MRPARRGPERQPGERGRVDRVIARHGDAEELEGRLVAARHRRIHDGLGQLFRGHAGGAGAYASGRALPPALLDADVEKRDADHTQKRDAGEVEPELPRLWPAAEKDRDETECDDCPISVALPIAELAGREAESILRQPGDTECREREQADDPRDIARIEAG